ncbi:Demethylmenaquinone methyltransferase [Choanephora cucurbitarum]|uniref:Demethylmenaquinone methyltransferase n=1 Tax=Choanephora cucurbitarum TaxID=101091 RepID=A0A1C7N8R2_9FUNG|nr:Demethylmenaquinone methyltransferase [Choanephora cucurbitarum]
MGISVSKENVNPKNKVHQPHRQYINSNQVHAATKKKNDTIGEKELPNDISQPQQRTISERIYHNIESSSYMLPKDDKEIDRLHQEHFVTKELLGFNIMTDALKFLDFQNDQLNVLDVCCGPATWLCETSLEYPNSKFIGVDMCSLWPQIIKPVNLSFSEANVLQGIPYPDKSFAFKTGEWNFVLSEIMRVLKDGGLLQCIELDMKVYILLQLTQLSNHLQKHVSYYKQMHNCCNLTNHYLVESFCSSFDLDASLGAKLDIMLTEKSELKIIQSEYREVPLGWGGPVGEAYLQVFQDTLEGLEPWLKQSLHVVEDQSYQELMQKTKQSLVESKSFMGLYAFLVVKPQ